MSEIVETEIEEEAAEVKPEKRLTHGQLILRRSSDKRRDQ